LAEAARVVLFDLGGSALSFRQRAGAAGVDVAVLDDEAAEVTEVGVVLGVPLDEQLDIAMANAVDDIAVTRRRMARRLTGIAMVSRTLDLDSQVIQGLPVGFRL
jgi:hypothetical protein